ncbi:MAG: hypothetical protein KDA64_04585 [Rhodospirillaceae bacterium]|nr:hypothetical protein [Rhodospirillaceae bacterium]
MFHQHQGPSFGARLFRVVLVLLVLTVIGGAIFLGFWDVQPPVERVERSVPRERFLP